MVADKSQYYYGSLYHRLFDGKLKEMRQMVLQLIPDGAKVLDIGCGTGVFCTELVEQKGCHVVGLDLSLKMLQFAQKNASDKVTFVHADATNLKQFADDAFDYACMLVFIHELPQTLQVQALKEALRVAPRLIVADSTVPLPRNFNGFLIRFVEFVFGHDHWPHFKHYLAVGGIRGVLEESGLPCTIEQQVLFWNGSRETVLLSRV